MRKLTTAPATLVLAGILAGSLAACGGGSSGGSAPSVVASDAAGKAAATKQIKTNYATFFNSATPQSTAVGLLENGDKLGPAITLAAKVAKKTHMRESARVKKVVFASPTEATVTYDLIGNGNPVLPGATGKAVLVGGTWKVGQGTFCTLVDLGAQTIGAKNPPNC